MRGVESHSGDDEERKDERQRDGGTDSVTSRLGIVGEAVRTTGAALRTAGWLLCVDITNLTGKRACTHEEKAPRLGPSGRTAFVDGRRQRKEREYRLPPR
jgi:hypothetical protein